MRRLRRLFGPLGWIILVAFLCAAMVGGYMLWQVWSAFNGVRFK